MKNTIPRFTLYVAVYATVFVLTTNTRPAGAGLIAYDGFNYSPTGVSIDGMSGNGSFGFAGPWSGTTDADFQLGSGSLASPAVAVPTSGNMVTLAGFSDGNRDAIRLFPSPLGTVGSSTYVSFLLRPDGTIGQGLSNGFFGLHLVSTNGTSNWVFIGKSGDVPPSNFAIETAGGSGRVATSTPVVSGVTELMVVRIDYVAGGADNFRLYVNPASLTEPATASAEKDGGVNFGLLAGLDLTGPGAYSIDELRVGDTYASVLPEPSSFALLGFGCLGLLGYLCSRRRTLIQHSGCK